MHQDISIFDEISKKNGKTQVTKVLTYYLYEANIFSHNTDSNSEHGTRMKAPKKNTTFKGSSYKMTY